MTQKNKHLITLLSTSALMLYSIVINAQEVNVIDNKGTIVKVKNNSVTTNTTAPTNPAPVEGDIWFDTTANSIKVYDPDLPLGSRWKIITSTLDSNNIYNSNGTLTGTRIITGANHSILFQGLTNFVVNTSGSSTITSTATNVFTSAAATTLTSTGDKVEISGLNGIDLNSNTQITGNLSLTGTFGDSSGAIGTPAHVGTAGQILSSTATGTNWIDNNNWSLLGNSGTNPLLNFVGTTDAQNLIFKTNNNEALKINQTNQYVGINVSSNLADPIATERLDVNGKLRVRDIATVTTNNDILTVANTGVIEKKKLIASEANNHAVVGANGGVYLGPEIYTGHLIVNGPGGLVDANFNQVITGIPFKPLQVTFSAVPNIEDLNTSGNGGALNTKRLHNTFGSMSGYARSDNAVVPTITQVVVFSGASASSVNSKSRYSSDQYCIGIRYTNQNGEDLGRIRASTTSFNNDGFTLSIFYTLGTGTVGTPTEIIDRNNDVLDEKLVVLFTAYR